jgi:hypothetical protein
MKAAWDEGYLRFRLREEWLGPPLVWVEAARGGSDGAPDVFVPMLGLNFIPVELKKWLADKNGIVKVEARPSQRRFHRLSLERGMKTFVLVLLSDMRVVLLPGEVMALDEISLKNYSLSRVGSHLDDVREIMRSYLRGGRC